MKKRLKKIIKPSPLWLNALAVILVPALFLTTCEWIHRGALNLDFFENRLSEHVSSFIIAYIALVLMYLFVLFVSYSHTAAAALTGIISNVPAVITWFKLQMRGEPFFPWDILQIEDFIGVASKVKLKIQAPMIFTILIFVFVCVALFFVRLPAFTTHKTRIRITMCASSGVMSIVFFYGVFLNATATQAIGIYSDMWMQDRYYKNHGVITGFLTNLQTLKIVKPENYTDSSIEQLKQNIQKNAESLQPFFAVSDSSSQKTPNIIYLMNESFWDVGRLYGIEFDRELTTNFDRISAHGASGFSYTPSFGGGTCDVEFEALTGFSLENLPSGAKPYQQHVTKDMFSLPQFLKSEMGYETLAIHGYNKKFWSRNSAYPRLGIDTFIASEDFIMPEIRRGFISDAEMTRRIIAEIESRKDNAPLFVHAVTMQNHTTYDSTNYDKDELVKILSAPKGITERTLDELSDFATGVYEADQALGELVRYLEASNQPTILVFFGDHFNPIGADFELYEKTGFIQAGEGASSPALHETSLCIWSNYSDTKVDLGTIATYNIAPVTMELYNLDMPLPFEYLMQQLPIIRARTRGITVNSDNTKTETTTHEQDEYIYNHSLIQYDLMFGEPYLEDYFEE